MFMTTVLVNTVKGAIQSHSVQICPYLFPKIKNNSLLDRMEKDEGTLIYCEGDRALGQVAQRDCGASFSEDTIFRSHLNMVPGNLLGVHT